MTRKWGRRPPPLDMPDHLEQPAVQILVLTIDGKKFVCIGPVMYMPLLGITVGDVQEIEFGEIVSTDEAMQMLDGTLAGEARQ